MGSRVRKLSAAIVSILLISVGLPVVAAPPAQADAQAGVVLSGAVLDSVGTPVPYVPIEVYRTEPFPAYVGTFFADEFGGWSTAGTEIAEGTFRLFADASSTALRSAWFGGASTPEESTSVEVVDGEQRIGLNFELQDGLGISGVVTYPGGLAAVGVTVQVRSIDTYEYRYAVSGADGTYTVPGLMPGGYVVGFSGAGIVEEFWDDKRPDETADTVVLVDESAVDVDAVLDPAASISGTVTSEGTALPYPAVQVTPAGSSWPVYYPTASDEWGNYTVGGLAPGLYDVQFVGSDSARAEWWDDVPDQFMATPIQLTVGESVAGVDADLAAVIGAPVSGIATSGGVPVVGASVTVAGLWAATDAEGRFTFPLVPAGSQEVSVYPNEDTLLATSVSVEVEADIPLTDVVVEVATAAVLTGLVTRAADDTAVVGGAVSVYRLIGGDEDYVDTVSTGLDGFYRLGKLKPGSSYRVVAFDPEGIAEQRSADTGPLSSGQTRFDLLLVGPVLGAGSVVGSVTDATDAPIPGIEVTVSGDLGSWSSAVTAADGTYSVSGLVSDFYDVTFRDPDDEFVTRRERIEVVEPASVVLHVTMVAAGSVSGTVVDGRGQPVTGGVTIEVYSQADEEWFLRSTVTDSVGAFTIRGLDPGAYRVRFTSRDTWDCDNDCVPILSEWWEDKPSEETSTPVLVAAGEEAVLSAVVAAFSTVRGTVRVGGVPLPATSVVAVPVGAAQWEWDYEFSTSTRPDGTFTLAVPPGDYKLLVERDGRRSFWYHSSDDRVSASVVSVGLESDVADLLIDAPFTGRVEGSVTRAGQPIDDARVQLIDIRGRVAASASTSDSGLFRIDGVAAGTYKLRTDSWPGGTQWFGGADEDAATWMTVTEDAPTEVDIDLGELTEARLTVSANLDGAPFGQDASVAFYRDSDGAYVEGCSWYQFDEAPFCSVWVPAGSYRVRVSPESGAAPTWYGGDSLATATPVVLGAGADADLSVPLQAGGNLVVVVDNATSTTQALEVVARNGVTGDDRSEYLELASGEEAEVPVNNLLPGTTEVTLISETTDEIAGGVVDVLAGEDTSLRLVVQQAAEDVQMAPPVGAITGRVLLDDGSPAGDVEVCASQEFGGRSMAPDPGRYSGCTVTSGSGTYTLEDLVEGFYEVDVRGDGVGYLRESSWIRHQPDVADPTTLPDVTLSREATLGGSVWNAAGQALSDVGITVYEPDGGPVGYATTGADGRWALSLRAGSYRVVADAVSDLYEPTFHGGTESFGSATSVALESGGSHLDADIVLIGGKAPSRTRLEVSPTAVVAGGTVSLSAQVLAAQPGGPTPTGQVEFVRNGVTVSTVALADGLAGTSMPITGSWAELEARYLGTASFGRSAAVSEVEVIPLATSTSLEVSPSAAQIGSDVTLSARVTGPGPDEINEGDIGFYGNGTYLGSASLQAGTASLTTRRLGTGSYRLSARYFGSGAFGSSASEPVEVIVSGSSSAARISGQVTSDSDAAVEVTVDLYSMSTGTPVFVRTDLTSSEGRFSFAGLTQGSYAIKFSGPGFVTEWWEDSPAPVVVDLVGGFELTIDAEVSRDPQADAGLSGLVTSFTGESVEGAYVLACATDGDICRSGFTDFDGHYLLPSLTPGAYRLTVEPLSGHLRPFATDLVLESGSEARNVILEPVLAPPAQVEVGDGDVSTTDDGLPVLDWESPVIFTYEACSAGSGTWSATDEAGAIVRTGDLVETSVGVYEGSIPALAPVTGTVRLAATVDCPSGPDAAVTFDVYIDPSGIVVDTDGSPIAGASVTLYRFDPETAAYEAVPDGSDVMSPKNRSNPDVTDGLGHFGWDVIAGHYKVAVEKEGCHAPGAPGVVRVSTGDLEIPPPVTDLELVLECTGDAATVPDAPTGVAGVVGPGSVALTWTAPSDGGSPILDYTVTASPGGASATVSGTAATVTGLSNGTSYTFTVTARNAIGSSTASVPSSGLTPRSTPGAPSAVAATPGDSAVVVTWKAPSAVGGSPVIDYTVTTLPGGASVTVPGLSATVAGLSNGSSYTFVVTARNAAGSSPASLPSPVVVPRRAPGTPVGVAASAGVASVKVTWSKPASDGGAPVIDYTVTATPGGAAKTVSGTSATFTGLKPGTAYTFAVTARNVAGSSAAATTARVVPIAPRSPSLTITSAASTVSLGKPKVSWKASVGTDPIARIEVRTRSGSVSAPLGAYGAATSLPASARSWAPASVAAGTAYCFSFRAVAGSGLASGWQERCTTVVADDKAFRASKGWRSKAKAGAIARAERVSTRQGATLTIPKAVGKGFVLVVGKQRGAGTIGVYVGGKRIGRYSLVAKATKVGQRITIPTGQLKGRSIVVRVEAARATGVRIDGFAVLK